MGWSAGLAGAPDDVFVGAQLLQAHGAPGVQFLGGDAHLAAQPELSPVGETGGGIDVDGGGIHLQGEQIDGRGILRDDALTVMGGVQIDVPDGLLHGVHHPDAQDVIQKLPVEVLFRGGGAVDVFRGLCVDAQFHRDLALGVAVIPQAGGQFRKELRRDILMDQKLFLGVAHAGTAGLGVFDDVQRHVLVGGLLHIHMGYRCRWR